MKWAFIYTSAMPVQNQFLCVFSNCWFGMFELLNSLVYYYTGA